MPRTQGPLFGSGLDAIQIPGIDQLQANRVEVADREGGHGADVASSAVIAGNAFDGHGKAPLQGQGFRRYGVRWWGGDDIFLSDLHRAFTMARLVGRACALGQAVVCF